MVSLHVQPLSRVIGMSSTENSLLPAEKVGGFRRLDTNIFMQNSQE